MNQDVYKLGVQYEWNDKWTLRAGYNYAESPIREEDGTGEMEFNVLAPATVEQHFTLGGTYNWKQNMELSFAYMYAPKNEQSAYVPIGTGLPFEDQDIEIAMKQQAFEISFAYKM